MASIHFNLFKSLWVKVKEKFAAQSDEPFTLENLNRLGLNLKQADWDKIEAKLAQAPPPKDINLSESAYKDLYKYLEVESLTDLDNVVAEIDRSDKAKLVASSNHNSLDLNETGFLGRKAELEILNKFLLTPEARILELYGVRMIGKSTLISHFLEHDEISKSYNHIHVELYPPPADAERRIKEVIFENRDFNDFSGFSPKTLVVLQNFEEALEWTGNWQKLHAIKGQYPAIKTFLEEITKTGTIKLIIESRIQVNFWSFLSRVPGLVETLEIRGVAREEFWQFYQSRGYSYEQFITLCSNFSDHTGLLALAYNNGFIYGRELINAVYRPKDATRYLWEYVEEIVKRLEEHDIFCLCALTLLKEHVRAESLYQILIAPGIFNDRLEIDNSLRSLEKKMLVQSKQVYYALNPYIREVCFTFLEDARKRQMQAISNLPYFKVHGEKPVYNRFRQAQERGDFTYLIQEGKRLRKARRYDEAFEAIEAGLEINPKPEYVLNEKAIWYRETGKLDKAIETWNILITKYKHLPAFNELAIYYRASGQIQEAINLLEQARQISPTDAKTLTELAISYRKNNQIKEAIEILNTLISEHNHLPAYNQLAIYYSEDENYDQSIKIAEAAIKLGHYRCYSVLANTYQRMGDLKMAYQIAQEGVKATNRQDKRLTEQVRQLERAAGQQAKSGNGKQPLKVFISYSRRDRDIEERIEVFLASLIIERKIVIWSDRGISSGEQWDERIKLELESADIILLLISQDFIQSEYIRKTEMHRALERYERNEAVVIPIYCRATDDFKEMPFAKLNGLPVNAIPISTPSNDAALAEVAKGIRGAVEILLQKREP